MKAQFHKSQRVWVECVGAWATIERIVPVWAKGFDEPVKITYDVGLGRDFLAHELEADRAEALEASPEAGDWRLMRAKNKWQSPDDCAHHPMPGSYPVVVTDANDWGGWRVPGAEYDRDPNKIEFQARLIAAAPRLMALAADLIDTIGDTPEDAPPELLRLALSADSILRSVRESPARKLAEASAADDKAA
jgi:hypothetical protein